MIHRRLQLLISVVVCSCLFQGAALFAQSDLVCYGDERFDSAWSQDLYADVSAGYTHTLGRRADGSVVAFGYNRFGACDIPAIPVGTTVVELDGSHWHSYLRLSDGTVIGFGDNGYGQLNAPALPLGLSWTQVSLGQFYTLLLRSDGQVFAFGLNSQGQCNVPPLPAGLTYVEISAGAEHALARRSDGSVVGFGSSTHGVTTIPSLPIGTSYVGVSAGGVVSLLLRSDGALLAFGYSLTAISMVPALPAGVSWLEMDAGWSHAIALRSDGAVVAWGANTFGQTQVPVLPSGSAALQVEAGNDHSVIRLADGRLITFGSDHSSQILRQPIASGALPIRISSGHFPQVLRRADGTHTTWGSSYFNLLTIPTVTAPTTLTSLVAGFRNTAWLKSDGTAVVHGDNAYGQTQVPTIAPLLYEEITTEGEHCVARLSDGTAIAFGRNTNGQCNVPPLPAGTSYVDVEAGDTFSIARRSDGVLVGFGSNFAGETLPPSLPLGLSWGQIALGTQHGIALRSDGTAAAWGSNSIGQTNVPALPQGMTYVRATAIDSWNALLRSDGTAVVFPTAAALNLKIPAGATFVDIDAGSEKLLAVRAATPVVNLSGRVRVATPVGSAVRGVRDALVEVLRNNVVLASSTTDHLGHYVASLPVGTSPGGVSIRATLNGIPNHPPVINFAEATAPGAPLADSIVLNSGSNFGLDIVVPKPVVLVHGVLGNSASWASFVTYLRLSPSLKWQLNQENSSAYACRAINYNFNLSLENAASVLEAEIASFRSDFSVHFPSSTPIDIIAHSSGGLVTRAWLDVHAQPGTVDKVVTLGTPHAGALLLLGIFGTPGIPIGIQHLDPIYVIGVFQVQHQNTQGARFVLAGASANTSLTLPEGILSPALFPPLPVEDDGIVSQLSSIWYPVNNLPGMTILATHTTPELHFDLISSLPLLRNTILPHLESP